MSNERTQQLLQTLLGDIPFANKIVDMDPYRASEALQERGFDFTPKDLETFGQELRIYLMQHEELSDADLDDVVGGCRHSRFVAPGFTYNRYMYNRYCALVRYRSCRW